MTTKRTTRPAAAPTNHPTRRRAVLAALTAPIASAAGAADNQEHGLFKAATLLLRMEPDAFAIKAAEGMIVGILYSRHKERPFPVPEWLANAEWWQHESREDREIREGINCSAHPENGLFRQRSYCSTCNHLINFGEDVHYRYLIRNGEKDATTHCAECCPACKKRKQVADPA
jgi:hypothetical protein